MKLVQRESVEGAAYSLFFVKCRYDNADGVQHLVRGNDSLNCIMLPSLFIIHQAAYLDIFGYIPVGTFEEFCLLSTVLTQFRKVLWIPQKGQIEL